MSKTIRKNKFNTQKYVYFTAKLTVSNFFASVFPKNKHQKRWITKFRRDESSLKDVKQNGIQTLRFQILKFSVKGACLTVGTLLFQIHIDTRWYLRTCCSLRVAQRLWLPETLRLFFFPEAVDPSIFEKIMFAKNLRKFESKL